MLMLDDHAIFKIVITKPDRDSEREWLFPSFWWWWYYVSLRFTLIAVHCVFCCLAVFFVQQELELSVGQFWWTMLGVAFGLQVFLLIACILHRITYETIIILFHVFRGTRDTVKAIERVSEVLSSISQVQISSGQYVCDRLAEVCDELKGVEE